MSGPRPPRLMGGRLASGKTRVHSRILIVLGYLAAVLAVGYMGRRRMRGGEEDFFLAGRTLGPLVLLATMAATNFSGFTVVGFSGAGYRMGFSFYPVMAYGTGLMALSFAVIGLPVWRLGRRFGLVTPPELLNARHRSRALTVVFALAMAVFTLPYLAIQPMAAGYALESLLGVPYVVGAGIVTALVLFYVLLGGMRSVVWTDVLQGVVMLVVLAAGFAVVARASGGLGAAYGRLASESPEHFTRPGAGGGLALGLWGSYMLLWFLADPMFPQLFQRFYAARGERSLIRTMALYPIVTTVLFFFPVALGVLGRLNLPGLAGKDTDKVLPLLMERFGGNWLAALAGAGLLAAIMSTMDSQLLTLGSMVERDLLGRGGALRPVPSSSGRTQHESLRRGAATGPVRAVLATLAVLGYLLALRPPATILAIATETFAGLAVLFPSVIAALYWRRATAAGAITSIVAGESAVVLYHFGLLPTFGLLPAIPAVSVAAAVVVAAGFACRSGSALPEGWLEDTRLRLSSGAKLGWTLVFAGFFAASVDWWRFGGSPDLVFGLPSWLLYFAVLGILLSAAFFLFGRALRPGGPSGPEPPSARRKTPNQRAR
jgi:SSS family solute:Na+ symporter